MYDGRPLSAHYGFRQPRSPVLVAECTKAWARDQVRQGVHPKRSIWIPGCCVGDASRPDIGDLFGPDETWKPARPLDAVSDDHLPHQTPYEHLRKRA